MALPPQGINHRSRYGLSHAARRAYPTLVG